MTSLAMRPSPSAPTDGSRTIVLHDSQPREGGSGSGNEDEAHYAGTLRLRGARSRQRVAWDEDVIDNEGMGKKKSKICCIYHKPKKFDESSDEEDSDEDSGPDDERRAAHRRFHHHHHHHGPECQRERGDGDGGNGVHELEDGDDVNAYEAPPRGKGKGRAT